MKPKRQLVPPVAWIVAAVLILILGMILWSLIPEVRGPTRRTIDASNLRQIGQAALIYAAENEGRLPENHLGPAGQPVDGGQTTVHRYAVALARSAGLNDKGMFISLHERHPRVRSDWREWNHTYIIRRDPDGLIYHPDFPSSRERRERQEIEVNPEFLETGISFQLIGGLTIDLPSATPIAFTRGLREDGRWDRDNGVYGSDGGHMVFIGGNVVWRRNLRSDDNRLTGLAGDPTANILETLSPDHAIYGDPEPPIADGTRGVETWAQGAAE